MHHYRVRLALESPLATPLHSGTLFGHLCWAWRELEGEHSLAAWLDGLGEKPFLISDGFPAGWLPRPLLAPGPRQAIPADARERREFLRKIKARKQARWIRRDDFLKVRAAVSPAALDERAADAPSLEQVSLPHNRIDRRTAQTLEEGGLYYVQERWPRGENAFFDVYIGADLAAERLKRLFEHVGMTGYGRDATWGRGRFRVTAVEEEHELFAFTGNRRMSLSHGSLTPNMLDPLYRAETHLGRLGNWLARSEQPFKFPLLLLQPGATFRPDGDGPFGELLDNVHPSPPDGLRIRHNAWHLTVGYREAEGS